MELKYQLFLQFLICIGWQKIPRIFSFDSDEIWQKLLHLEFCYLSEIIKSYYYLLFPFAVDSTWCQEK